MPDGTPQSTPVWLGRDGENLVICTSDGSLKGGITRRDRECLVDCRLRNPYEEVQIRGALSSGVPTLN